MVSLEEPWPTELKLSSDKRLLTVTFDNGESYALDAEYLRVMTPSAEAQGHGPDSKKTVFGKMQVAIMGVEPVGHYAVKLIFDDLHASGFYTWLYLRDLGLNRATHWERYLAELATKGLHRDL